MSRTGYDWLSPRSAGLPAAGQDWLTAPSRGAASSVKALQRGPSDARVLDAICATLLGRAAAQGCMDTALPEETAVVSMVVAPELAAADGTCDTAPGMAGQTASDAARDILGASDLASTPARRVKLYRLTFSELREAAHVLAAPYLPPALPSARFHVVLRAASSSGPVLRSDAQVRRYLGAWHAANGDGAGAPIAVSASPHALSLKRADAPAEDPGGPAASAGRPGRDSPSPHHRSISLPASPAPDATPWRMPPPPTVPPPGPGLAIGAGASGGSPLRPDGSPPPRPDSPRVGRAVVGVVESPAGLRQGLSGGSVGFDVDSVRPGSRNSSDGSGTDVSAGGVLDFDAAIEFLAVESGDDDMRLGGPRPKAAATGEEGSRPTTTTAQAATGEKGPQPTMTTAQAATGEEGSRSTMTDPQLRSEPTTGVAGPAGTDEAAAGSAGASLSSAGMPPPPAVAGEPAAAEGATLAASPAPDGCTSQANPAAPPPPPDQTSADSPPAQPSLAAPPADSSLAAPPANPAAAAPPANPAAAAPPANPAAAAPPANPAAAAPPGQPRVAAPVPLRDVGRGASPGLHTRLHPDRKDAPSVALYRDDAPVPRRQHGAAMEATPTQPAQPQSPPAPAFGGSVALARELAALRSERMAEGPLRLPLASESKPVGMTESLGSLADALEAASAPSPAPASLILQLFGVDTKLTPGKRPRRRIEFSVAPSPRRTPRQSVKPPGAAADAVPERHAETATPTRSACSRSPLIGAKESAQPDESGPLPSRSGQPQAAQPRAPRLPPAPPAMPGGPPIRLTGKARPSPAARASGRGPRLPPPPPAPKTMSAGE